MNNTIFTIDLTRVLPPTLRQDQEMLALAQVIGAELQENSRLARLNIIYARIDELPENVLDILAHDLHIDWYDYAYPMDAKRRTIKDSVKVHRRLGTRYAVETALGNVFPGSKVEEWFEYGAEPFLFRIVIDCTTTDVTAEKQSRVIERMWFYKNLRSHLDTISYQMHTLGHVNVGAYHTSGTDVEVYPCLVKNIEASGVAGIGAYITTEIALEMYPLTTKWIQNKAEMGLAAILKIALAIEIFPAL